MTVFFNEGFESTTNGTAITNVNTTFTSTTVPAGATVNGSTTQAFAGSLSMQVVTPGTFAATYALKTGMALPGGTDSFIRFYAFFATDFIAAAQSPGVIRGLTAAAATCWNLRPTTAGLVQVQDGASATIAAANGTVPIAMNQWVRFEVRVKPSTTVGEIEWWLYNTASSGTASDHGSATGQVLGADWDGFRLGQYASTGHAAATHYYDGVTVASDLTFGAGSTTPPYQEYMPYSDMGPGFFGPNPFRVEDYPPITLPSLLTFDMGTTQAILNLNGIVYSKLLGTVKPPQAALTLTGLVPKGQAISHPGAAAMNLVGIVPTKLQAVVKPPVPVVTLSGLVPSLRARFPISVLAPFNFRANAPIVANSATVFDMGTTQAIVNLNGIVYSKLLARANSPVGSLSLVAQAPKESARVFPLVAPLSLTGNVPRPQVVERPGLAAMNLVGLTQVRNIVKVQVPVATLILLSQPPTDPTAIKATQVKIRALGEANQSASGERISR